MPRLNIVLPASIDSALREAAKIRGTSVNSLASAALGEYLQSHDHRMYQISTSTALVEGVDKGAVSSRTLLEHGDFGLGTFENLDGEMVVVDGAIYQVRGDGGVTRREDDFQIPFAVVTRFREEKNFEAGVINCMKDLELACDPQRESDNLFFGLKVEGTLESLNGHKMLRRRELERKFRITRITR